MTKILHTSELTKLVSGTFPFFNRLNIKGGTNKLIAPSICPFEYSFNVRQSINKMLVACWYCMNNHCASSVFIVWCWFDVVVVGNVYFTVLFGSICLLMEQKNAHYWFIKCFILSKRIEHSVSTAWVFR